MTAGTAADAGPYAPPGLPRVAFQGEPGAFSDEVIREFFGQRAVPVPCREFHEVCDAVLTGAAAYGVLPVENTIVGRVAAAADALAATGLVAVAEVIRPIRLCLLGVPGATLAGVRRVISHPVALAQCTRFLAGHAPIEAAACHDTAGAALEVARNGDPTVAAVAGRGAAERYGLALLAGDIQDRPDNRTRFVVVRRVDATV